MVSLEALWSQLMERTDYESCRRPRGLRLDLAGVERVLAAVGNPHHQAKVLHLAGSKGKGSTAHYLERGLRAAGWKTGLYTSPHLHHWRERIQVGGRPAPDAAWARALEPVLAASNGSETFFDLLTATALLLFRQQGCDAWVVEVGLGGRLDSTNVVQPLAAAVTSIEAEHTEVLGRDLPSIAKEKAGIYKTGARLWSGLETDHCARSVLQGKAGDLGQELQELPGWPEGPTPEDAKQAGPLPFMARNLALAKAMLADLATQPQAAPGWGRAAACLQTMEPVALQVPGRFEVRADSRGRTVIYDVAHTRTSLQQVILAYRRLYPKQRRGVVLALRADKDAEELAAALGPIPRSELWYTAPAGDHPQSADPVALAQIFGARALPLPVLPPEPEVLLVTGSTYLVGFLRPADPEALS